MRAALNINNPLFLGLKFLTVSAVVFGCNSIAVHAQEKTPVPEKLFGIELGQTFTFEPKEPVDGLNLPIKNFRGINKFLGEGVHFYFEPLEVNESFPYIEYKKKEEDEFYRTSYSLYLLPIIPPNVKSIDDLNDRVSDWQVAYIRWGTTQTTETKTKLTDSEKSNMERDDYYWAYGLCSIFTAALKPPPIVIDNIDTNWYECRFSAENRDLKVSSFTGRKVELGYKREVFDEMNARIDTLVKQLQAKELLR